MKYLFVEYDPVLHRALDAWQADRIWFAEYYHGYRTRETLVTQLPDVVKYATAQLVLITFVMVGWLGKRFGKPVPYYEEIEREENEHIKALAKLYMIIKNPRR